MIVSPVGQQLTQTIYVDQAILSESIRYNNLLKID